MVGGEEMEGQAAVAFPTEVPSCDLVTLIYLLETRNMKWMDYKESRAEEGHVSNALMKTKILAYIDTLASSLSSLPDASSSSLLFIPFKYIDTRTSILEGSKVGWHSSHLLTE